MDYRMYCSWERWKEIMGQRPAHLRGGCQTPARETGQTCVTTGIDQDIRTWLQSQGVKVELIS